MYMSCVHVCIYMYMCIFQEADRLPYGILKEFLLLAISLHDSSCTQPSYPPSHSTFLFPFPPIIWYHLHSFPFPWNCPHPCHLTVFLTYLYSWRALSQSFLVTCQPILGMFLLQACLEELQAGRGTPTTRHSSICCFSSSAFSYIAASF